MGKSVKNFHNFVAYTFGQVGTPWCQLEVSQSLIKILPPPYVGGPIAANALCSQSSRVITGGRQESIKLLQNGK